MSGAHGAADGTTEVDYGQFVYDQNTFLENPNVVNYNWESVVNSGEINGLVNGSRTTILGFCNSGACLAALGP